jgi:hypothetical protein
MRLYWQIFFAPDEGGAGGGAGGGEGTGGDKGAGGENSGSNQNLTPNSQSLRAQLASQFEAPEERTKFEEWANKHVTDKDFAKSVKSMRDTYDARVPIPGPEARPEDLHKFYTRIGKPETAKDYKFEWGENKLDDPTTARFEGFKEFAHANNLSQAQFENLIKWNEQTEGGLQESLAAQVDAFQGKAVETLRQEWGPDFDANLEYAKAAGLQFADSPEEYKSFMDMTILGKEGGMRVGDHPVLLKIQAKIGRLFSEDARIRHMEKSGEAETIQGQISAIEEEARKANRSTSERQYHERLEPLYKKLYPAKHKAGGQR